MLGSVIIEPTLWPAGCQPASGTLEHEDNDSTAFTEILGRGASARRERGQDVPLSSWAPAPARSQSEAISFGRGRRAGRRRPLLARIPRRRTEVMAASSPSGSRTSPLAATPNGPRPGGTPGGAAEDGLRLTVPSPPSTRSTGLLVGEVTGFGQGILATSRCRSTPQMAKSRPGVFPGTNLIRAGRQDRKIQCTSPKPTARARAAPVAQARRRHHIRRSAWCRRARRQRRSGDTQTIGPRAEGGDRGTRVAADAGWSPRADGRANRIGYTR